MILPGHGRVLILYLPVSLEKGSVVPYISFSTEGVGHHSSVVPFICFEKMGKNTDRRAVRIKMKLGHGINSTAFYTIANYNK